MIDIGKLKERISAYKESPLVKKLSEPLRQVSQIIAPQTTEAKERSQAVEKAEERVTRAKKIRDGIKEFPELEDKVKKSTSRAQHYSQKINNVPNPDSFWGKQKKRLYGYRQKAHERKVNNAEEKMAGTRKAAKSIGLNVNRHPEAVEKSKKKVDELEQKLRPEKETKRRARQDDHLSRANNRLSTAGNLSKSRSDIVNFITSTVEAVAKLQGPNSDAAKVINKWKTATGQLTVSLSSFLVPALETLTGFVTYAVERLNTFVETFPNLSKWIGYAVGALVALMAIIVPIVTITGTVSAAIAGLGSAVTFFSGLIGVVTTVIGVIVTVVKGLFLGIAAFTGPIWAIVAVLAAVGAILYAFSDEIFAVISGIAEFILFIFSSIGEAITGFFSGFSWFSDDEEKQAKKVNDYKDKAKTQTVKIENTVPNSKKIQETQSKIANGTTQTQSNVSNEIAKIQSKTSSGVTQNQSNVSNEVTKIQSKTSNAISIKAATCILALSGGSVALAAEQQVSEQVAKYQSVQSSSETTSSVNETLDKSIKTVSANTSDVTQADLPEGVGKASQVVADNQIVADNSLVNNESNSTEVTGDVTQIASGTKLSNKETNSLYVEGTKIEINVTAEKGSDAQTLAAAIRRELEQQQAQQLRQLRGMLND